MRLSDLDRARGRVADLKASRAEVARTYELSRDETREALRQRFAAWQADGERALRAHVALVAQCDQDGPMFAAAVGGRAADLGPSLALLLGPDELVQRLDRVLATIPEGVPSADRSRRLADLDAQLFEAELAEERVVMALEATGATVRRRPDADPRAVLALQIVEPTK
jgi:hypothetical protein